MAELDYLLTFAEVPFCSDVGADGLFLDLIDPDMKEDTDVFVRNFQPLPDLMDEINRVLPFQYLHDFTPPITYPGRNLGAVAKQWQEIQQPSPAVRVGDWFYPNGACRWSVFRGLATSTMAKQMLAITGGTSTARFYMRQVPSTPYAAADALYTLESYLYMLPPRPLGELGGSFDGLYLITLVDERYYWQNTPVSLRVTKDTTWQGLINELATALNVTIAAPTIAAAYSKPEPDSQLWTNMENAAVLLDAIAFNLGKVVIRNLDGSYRMLGPTESQTVVATNRPAPVVRLAGGDMFAPATQGLPVGDLRAARNAIVPQQVTVTFPKYVKGDDPVPHFLNARYANQRPSCWFEESYGDTHNIDIPVASGGLLVSGLTGTGDFALHTTAKALYDTEVAASGNPLNVSGLRALALQIAQDYYQGQVAAALDEVYPGTYAWSLEGIHDVVWTWSERQRLASTRVTRSPWNQVVTEFQHSAPALAGETNVTKGVGGPSVPQTWRDHPMLLSGIITAVLTDPLTSGGLAAAFDLIDNFPTQNRWKGRIETEDILFEGTSGGTSVGIALRGIDGTIQTAHAGGATVYWLLPNTVYGANLVSHEKMQWIFPQAHTSGGIQEVVVVPQTQTVLVQAASGVNLGGVIHYSGAVLSYDTVAGVYIGHETVWVRERNDDPVVSGKRYDGQFAGFSLSGRVSPVYLINAAGSGLAGGGGAVQSGTIQWFHFVACGLSGINCSGFIFTHHLSSGVIKSGLISSGTPLIHTILDPTYHIDTVSGTPVKGDFIVGNSGNKWQRFPVGSISGLVPITKPDELFGVIWGNIPPTSGTGPHALLDPTVHTDTISGAPLRGTFIVGNSGGKWQYFDRGAEDTLPISRSGNLQGVVWELIDSDNIRSGGIGFFSLGSGATPNNGGGEDWSSIPQVGTTRRGPCWFAGGDPATPPDSTSFSPYASCLYALPFLVATYVTMTRVMMKTGTGNISSGKMRIGLYNDGGQTDHYPSSLVASTSGAIHATNHTNLLFDGELSANLAPGVYWLLLFVPPVASVCAVHGWINGNQFYMNRCVGFNPISGITATSGNTLVGILSGYAYPGDVAALPDPAPTFFYLSGHWNAPDLTDIPGVFFRYA